MSSSSKPPYPHQGSAPGPAGRILSTVPWFCPPPKQISGYAPGSGLCSPETPTLTELAESIDDTLFERIMHNPYHVIYHLLPPRRELSYNIRQRHHDRQLNSCAVGILFSACCSRTVIDCFYISLFLYSPFIACVLEQMRSVICLINKYDDEHLYSLNKQHTC